MDAATITARLIYRDALMLVLDKPSGLPVHRDGRGGETLTDWLDDLRFGLPRRPELAHRLDRDTSGCLVLGRHPRALARLSSLFATGAVEKRYWALVEGGPQEEAGTIDLPLARRSPDRRDWRMRVAEDGQPSLTHWRRLGSVDGLAWLELTPVTGRTHQLRVHCAAMGWPILGDATYGGTRAPRLMLHARSVTVPLYPKKPAILVEAPVPPPMAEALGRIVQDAPAMPAAPPADTAP
ncbi:RluA family pseudouridine synthase [Enterovirga rhinocerotis]|uniref:tRNA pseudouridine32 synthase/23S rRNA pseudouridine746 synthase n=1 Tax=Enterovirga rhinocerotis TaxID=1339210 RepID=A0A4R7C3X5_9HYPH|nr:RNA pseudouridine synthase [Enterovirga rhinocerotis]TDR93200.1 tRNA pseudouridine32 synthase/23S rRNA pseudouridine746 synthase [Enterovirga rhinocerotis]